MTVGTAIRVGKTAQSSQLIIRPNVKVFALRLPLCFIIQTKHIHVLLLADLEADTVYCESAAFHVHVSFRYFPATCTVQLRLLQHCAVALAACNLLSTESNLRAMCLLPPKL